MVGVDGSEHSREALKWAADEAETTRIAAENRVRPDRHPEGSSGPGMSLARPISLRCRRSSRTPLDWWRHGILRCLPEVRSRNGRHLSPSPSQADQPIFLSSELGLVDSKNCSLVR